MNRALLWGGSALTAGLLAVGLSSAIPSGHILAATPTTAANTTTVTVYGSSVQNVVPTQGTITVGVTDQQSTAQSALSINSQKMTTVIQALKAMGIPSKDIATSGLSIYPQYGNGNPGPLVGYQIQNLVTISVPTSQVGRALDTAVGAGANQVQGVSFTSTPRSSEGQSAYEQALGNALSQAKILATALHDQVLGPVSISFASNNGSSSQVFNAMSAPSITPVMPGQQQQMLTLKVVYRIGS